MNEIVLNKKDVIILKYILENDNHRELSQKIKNASVPVKKQDIVELFYKLGLDPKILHL